MTIDTLDYIREWGDPGAEPVDIYYMVWSEYIGLFPSAEQPLLYSESQGDRYLGRMSFAELREFAESVGEDAPFEAVEFQFNVFKKLCM